MALETALRDSRAAARSRNLRAIHSTSSDGRSKSKSRRTKLPLALFANHAKQDVVRCAGLRIGSFAQSTGKRRRRRADRLRNLNFSVPYGVVQLTIGRPTAFEDFVACRIAQEDEAFHQLVRAATVSRENDSVLREVRNFLKRFHRANKRRRGRLAAQCGAGGVAETSPRELDSCAALMPHQKRKRKQNRLGGVRAFQSLAMARIGELRVNCERGITC